MTETEWLYAKKPFSCQEIVKDFGSARKLRLLMVGYLEGLQAFFSSGASSVFLMLREWAEDKSQAIDERSWSSPRGPLRDHMERSPKGLASAAVRWVVHDGLRVERDPTRGIYVLPADVAYYAAEALVLNRVGNSPGKVLLTDPLFQAWNQAWQNRSQDVRAQQADLMRCVYGNPFSSKTIDPRWFDSNNGIIRDMAQAIYDQRAFDRLPILADALEEAGCTSRDILTHCRSNSAHTRGCWVVDLILNKS